MIDDPIRIPGFAARKEIVIPNKAEIGTLLTAMTKHRPYEMPHTPVRRVPILSLSLFAGMRRGEIYGLHWEDVDVEAGLITIWQSVSRQDGFKTPKTRAGRRVVPLSPILADVLDRYAQETGFKRRGQTLRTIAGRHVCVESTGGPEWFILMEMAGLLDEKGRLQSSLHVMRHAFISLLIEQGVSPIVMPIVIKAVAGHARIATTMDTYGHLFPKNAEARRDVARLGSHFGTAQIALPAPVPQIACQSREDWAKAKEQALALLASGVPTREVARRFSTDRAVVNRWQRAAQRDAMPT